ncbi:MAG: aldo/keto reductase [Planctomycetaceae bacterium]|nr:aldo/keto reductase [Planctomycetaceae bacterium]
MHRRPLGTTGLDVTPIGFGAFKIGRNQNTKYPQAYPLMDEVEAIQLLHDVLDLGINLIDTAPAYGLSEERIGQALADRRQEFVLSTKTGEQFENGTSTYDYTAQTTRKSIEGSLARLQTEVLDIVYVHSNGEDVWIQQQTEVVETLHALKRSGLIRAIGFSPKSIQGAELAMDWADVLMLEYHLENQEMSDVITRAHAAGIGTVIKKGLASGHLPAQQAIRFVLDNPGVDSLIVGGSKLLHLAENCRLAGFKFRNRAA